jgi:hypothetical protein
MGSFTLTMPAAKNLKAAIGIDALSIKTPMPAGPQTAAS